MFLNSSAAVDNLGVRVHSGASPHFALSHQVIQCRSLEVDILFRVGKFVMKLYVIAWYTCDAMKSHKLHESSVALTRILSKIWLPGDWKFRKMSSPRVFS